MRKINLTPTGVLSVLAFVFAFGAGPIHARVIHFHLPACPIKEFTVPPTKKEIRLPDENTLHLPMELPPLETFSVAGTVQVTDQSSSTVSLTQYDAVADPIHVVYARTLKTLQHATGQLTFDKGCTKTDPYGSNNCTWTWGQSITEAYQGALQEDITAGKLIVDLSVNNATKVQFACPVCGEAHQRGTGTCTVTIPEDKEQTGHHGIWGLMTLLFHFPLFLTFADYPNPF